jgi:hypothetical protein
LSSEQGFCPLHPALHPKLQALNRFHLPVIVGMEIPLCGANMGMAHQSLDGSKIIPIIQKGRGKGVPNYMRMNPFLDQGLLCCPTTLRFVFKGLILIRHRVNTEDGHHS